MNKKILFGHRHIFNMFNALYFCLGVFILSLIPNNANAQWNYVGDSTSISTNVASQFVMAMNGSVPYVIFSESTGVSIAQQFSVKKFDGINWVLVGNANISGSPEKICIAFDGSTPYIAYTEGTNSFKVIVRKFNGTTWDFVGSSSGITLTNIFHLDLRIYNGVPYIAYANNSSSQGTKANVLKFNGSSWVNVGAGNFSAGQALYITLNFIGSTPYVVYADGANGIKATVKKFDGTNWVNVGTPGFTLGTATFVTMTNDGTTPYIAYSDNANGDKASVMKYDGSTWIQVGTAGFSASSIQYPSITMDGSTPYLSFKDNSVGGRSTVMKYNGSTWQLVGNAGFSGSSQSVHTVLIHASIPYVTCKNSTGRAALMAYGLCASTSNINQNICQGSSYTFNSIAQTTSGTYYDTLLNVAGCDSIITLNLTVNTPSSNTTTISACSSYTWNVNSQIYTSTGVYTLTSLNAAGCLHSETLDLTINPISSSNTTTDSACNTYTWAANGMTYTASGTYTHITSSTPSTPSYCSTSNSLSFGNYISNVTIGSINNNTSNNDYSDYTAMSAAVTAGSTYTISVTDGNPSSLINLTVWADWNQNGDFTDAGEEYILSYNAPMTAGNIAVPITAMDGNVRMRVRIQEESSGISSCGNAFLGEVEDYTLTVSGGASGVNCHAEILNLTITTPVVCQNGGVSNGLCGCNCPPGYYGTACEFALCSTTYGSSSVTVCDSYTWNGNNYTVSGTYTGTFTNGGGCDSIHTLNLTLQGNSSGTSTSITANGCYTWSTNNVSYTVSGTYTHTSVNGSGCIHTDTLVLNLTQQILLSVKAFLQGPYNGATGLMSDSLRVLGLIPLTEPYTSAPLNKTPIGGLAGEAIDSSILNVSGSNAIVDWVFLEIRSVANNATVIANKRALIQRDGDIVSTDGVSAVPINVPQGNYFVSLKHRNHLGIMTSNAMTLNACTTNTIDFTTGTVFTNVTYVNPPRKLIGTVYAMWSGDANNNKNTKYNGLNNDKDHIMNVLGGPAFLNSILGGYRIEDGNLNGKTSYNGPDNDRVIILNNVGTSTVNNVIHQHTPN